MVSLQKLHVFHLLIKKEEEGMFAIWKHHTVIIPCPPCVLPAQPTLTETLEIQLWENFTVCPDISHFPVQIHIFSLKLETVEIF